LIKYESQESKKEKNFIFIEHGTAPDVADGKDPPAAGQDCGVIDRRTIDAATLARCRSNSLAV
jgi:hypothetical protein